MDQCLGRSTMKRKANRYNDPSYIDSIAHYNKRHKPNNECKNVREETGELNTLVNGINNLDLNSLNDNNIMRFVFSTKATDAEHEFSQNSSDGDVDENGINNLGLNSLNVNKTRFVISTTATVQEHDFSEDSSDEDVDENFNRLINQSHCINVNFPFKPVTKTTAEIKTKDIILDDKKLEALNLLTNSQVVDPFLKKVQRGGFEITEKNSKISTVAVSIGLNRMHSVSSRKNNLLNLELQSKINAHNINYETFGFYWTCKWYNIYDKEVEFKNVRRFYKKLKKFNPDLAKRFVIEEQIFSKNRQNIPYQDIREYAKNHDKTKKLIAKFREDDSNAIVYLSLIDADVLNFNGVFSAYLRIIDGCHLIPSIMTTGYEYSEQSRAFKLFSRMDRMIRVITASYIPLGTYYPEPNMSILVPQNCDTVPESFIDRKRGGRKTKGKTHESPVLLTAIQNSRGSAVRAIFSEDNAVIVTIPDRAKKNKETKEDLDFSSEFVMGPANPSKSDIELGNQISQSHSDNFNWLNSLFINKAIKYDKNYETDVENCGANIIDLSKPVDMQCRPLIRAMEYDEDVNSVQQLKSELARLIGMDYANNIAEVIEVKKKYNEDFYEQHERTPEEQELIDIMKEESADFMKLPKGFLLRIVTSPIMSLIKNNTIDIALLCQQKIDVIESFVDDHRILQALKNKDVVFEDLIDCIDEDIYSLNVDPLAALLMKEDESVEIVRVYPETVGYALKNGFIDEEDVRHIRAQLLGDRKESAAEQEFQMYYYEAIEGDGDDYFYSYEDPSDPCGMYASGRYP